MKGMAEWLDLATLGVLRVVSALAVIALSVWLLSWLGERLLAEWRGWRLVFEFAQHREAFMKWRAERRAKAGLET